MKLLQAIIVLCGLVGLPMGFSLLVHQAERDDATKAPCLDATGEPTC